MAKKLVLPIQQTLVLVKPDGILMGCAGKIKDRYVAAGLKVIFDSPVRFSSEQVMRFYQDHAGEFYFPSLLVVMTDKLCRAFVLEGEDAINKVRILNGPTDPSKAPKGTIRGDFRSGGGPCNTVHSSDSWESFKHELTIFSLASGSDFILTADFQTT